MIETSRLLKSDRRPLTAHASAGPGRCRFLVPAVVSLTDFPAGQLCSTTAERRPGGKHHRADENTRMAIGLRLGTTLARVDVPDIAGGLVQRPFLDEARRGSFAPFDLPCTDPE